MTKYAICAKAATALILLSPQNAPEPSRLAR